MAVKSTPKDPASNSAVENADTSAASEEKFSGLASAPQVAGQPNDQPFVGEIRKQKVQLQSGAIRNIRVRITKTRSTDPDEPQEKK